MKTRIVTVISDKKNALNHCLNAKKLGTDILELRFDLLYSEHSANHEEISQFSKQIRKSCPLPVIGTFRLKNEGGNWKNDAGRLVFIKSVLPYVDYIDLEVRSKLAAQAASGTVILVKPVIYSYHNFVKTEQISAITSYFKHVTPLKRKFLKVAQAVNKPSDFELQCRLFSSFKNKGAHMTIIPMARSSKQAMLRVVAGLIGSSFAYTFVGDSVAPGQIDLKTLKSILK